MDSTFDDSVTQWLAQLKKGDEDAARKLWDRYFDRLVRLARQELGSASRRVADEEDVALSVFDALCRGADEGRFNELADREELWRLLVAITARKAVDQLRLEGRVKRGGGAVRGDSIFLGASGQPDAIEHVGFDQILSDEPSPSFLVLLAEQHRRLIDSLDDESLRQVARFRIEGFSNEEIAGRMGISLRSVERKLSLIREAWSQEISGAKPQPTESHSGPDSPLDLCPLFRAVPREVLQAQMTTRDFEPGEALIRQGEVGTELLLISDGCVEIRVRTRDGQCHVIDTARRGDVLGEMALLTREPRTADAIAVDHVRVLVLAAEQFHELAHGYPELSVVLAELVAGRLGKPDCDALTDKVLDRYRIAARLGRGGMGVVYRAEELPSGQPRALKMMSHRLVYDREALARFQREADIIQSLDHPNIVRMFGRFAAFHTYFLALEYCPGRTLDTVLASDGAQGNAAKRRILSQLAAAIDYAHRANIVHRDIKPANIMLTEEGRVKLMDFGLAEPVAAPGRPGGRIVGTPRYMAPEQRGGDGASCRSDYFSFGCVAFELLTGRPLFEGGVAEEIGRDFRGWQPPQLPLQRTELDDDTRQVIAVALKPDPRDRRLDLQRIAGWVTSR